MGAYILAVKVRFRDLDAIGHVNSSCYFTYAESARVDFLTEGVGENDMERLGLILAGATAEFRAVIRKNDAVEVAMTVSRIGTKSWDFEYDIREPGTGRVYAKVHTVQVAYDYKTATSHAIPTALMTRLKSIQAVA